MQQKQIVILLGLAVLLASLALVFGASSAWLVGISGFFFVVGGTILAAIVSEGFERVQHLLRNLPFMVSERLPTLGADEDIFLQITSCYRRGSVRQTELGIKGLQDPLLHLGAQLIVDRCDQRDLERALQWQVANFKEQEQRRLRILYGMAGFAPAFGMLGTLLGLVKLLFSLGDSGLDIVGAAMGFAMITTVYGLVTANLIIKPLAIKMEQRLREKLAWQKVKYQILMLLFEKEHPAIVQETLEAFSSGRSASTTNVRPSPVELARA